MKKYNNYQLDFIEKVVTTTGPRLPTSIEESIGAEIIADELTKITGNKSKIEYFDCHPLASIASIPVLGYLLMFLVVPFYILIPVVALVLISAFLLFTTVQIFNYWDWFNFIFPKGRSQNVYNIIEPESKKVDFTVIISGHVDSSWFWKPIAKDPKRAWLGTIYGLISGIALLLLSLLRVLDGYRVITLTGPWKILVIILLIPGFYLLSQLITWNRKNASPGAIDNLSGVSIALWFAKYFKRNPEKKPKNCRIILAAFGCEEAGLKGSKAFVELHKKDLLKGNVWCLNIDGIGDPYKFHIIERERMLGTKFDKNFCKMADEAMHEEKIHHSSINMSLGGTDASSFAKAGIKAISLTTYDTDIVDTYHTYLDTTDKIDKNALILTNKICFRIIKKIEEHVRKNK